MKKKSTKKDISGAAFELVQLLGPRARPDLAEWFGVSVATLQRYLDGSTVPPLSVLKLARLRFGGDLADLLGPAWGEVRMVGGCLALPGWRRPVGAQELRALFWKVQQLGGLQQEVERLREERRKAWEAAQASEDRAAWYRRQLRLESRLGAMLGRVWA